MVRIRLSRVGAKKQPSYRVIVADQHAARDGRFIEIIGHYNPRTEPNTMVIDGERARYWLGTGAQPSEAVARMLVKLGITDQSGQVLEAPVVEEAAAAPAAAPEAQEAETEESPEAEA